MSKTNDNTSKPEHRVLTDIELDAVSGGQREPTYHPAKVTVPDLKAVLGNSPAIGWSVPRLDGDDDEQDPHAQFRSHE